jgi:signal transduction histidine kinase
MEDSGRKLSPAARLSALESWREKVLRGMLTVGAIVSPLIVVMSFALRSGPSSWPEIAGFIGGALAFPVLRFAPKLSVTTRATLAIGFAYVTGVIALTTFGFSSGPGIVLAGTSILAVVFLGRVRGFTFIALSVAAFFVVGALAVRGRLSIHGADLDPTEMRNWSRIGTTFAFLTILLTTAIDFVIRRVEESMRDTAEALTDLRAAYERLALLHERFDAAKEEERRFVAHELHDELGQMLTVVKLRLTAATNGGTPAGRAPAAETIGLIDGMIERVRRISTDLRPPLLDEVGLFPALRAHVDAQSALSGVAIELDANEVDNGHRLDSAREIACFRVVQEAITNALRHASPHRIQVRVIRRPATISLSIADDGRGFDPSTLTAAAGGHLGVAGMEERVRARGGRFQVSSRPGAGTTVAVEMPTAP